MPAPHDMVVPRNIRAELTRRDIPQADLAAAWGMSQQGVSLKLHGHRPITADQIARAAELLGIDPGVLFRRIEQTEQVA